MMYFARVAALTVAKAWRGAAGSELPELRKGLVAVFNDRFAEQLLDTAKVYLLSFIKRDN